MFLILNFGHLNLFRISSFEFTTHFYKICLMPRENKKSKNPKNKETPTETAITTTVKTTACFLVGQFTCFNSVLVSFM